jgi:hypothetical protein
MVMVDHISFDFFTDHRCLEAAEGKHGDPSFSTYTQLPSSPFLSPASNFGVRLFSDGKFFSAYGLVFLFKS